MSPFPPHTLNFESGKRSLTFNAIMAGQMIAQIHAAIPAYAIAIKNPFGNNMQRINGGKKQSNADFIRPDGLS